MATYSAKFRGELLTGLSRINGEIVCLRGTCELAAEHQRELLHVLDVGRPGRIQASIDTILDESRKWCMLIGGGGCVLDHLMHIVNLFRAVRFVLK